MPEGGRPRILLSAGEPSGDLHGGPLVAALKARWPGARVCAFGGPKMEAAGAEILWRMEDFSAFGFAEVLSSIPKHVGLMREMEALLDRERFDLVIPIDYPGFNLRLAERVKRRGIKLLYFIPPAVWAWHRSRVEKLRRFCDRLAVILPFEERFYREHGIAATYVGNPLVDRPWPTRDEARQRLGFTGSEAVVGIFPGSRRQEIERLWPPMRDAARTLMARGVARRAVVAGTKQGAYPDAEGITIHRGDPLEVFASADVALAKSGTTTLECALAGVPMVVGYKAHWITAWLARRLTNVGYVAQPNLILDRMAFPELLQEECTTEALVARATPLFDPASPEGRAQREAVAEVRRLVGGPGAAVRAAEVAAELVGA
ncbi:MAG TPA: lipid-A-disaccharide synthase [Gemmatimonadales bacterium]|nr:lipid-A-disaccharide synthase [Gemmatimonadales bacterium]